MTINPPTKAAKKAETKQANRQAAYKDALEKELRLVNNTSKNPDRIKDIEAELAKFKPAKAAKETK